MKNIYYVYEWIRLDTNEPFYVGKGHGDRWKTLTRKKNNHFNNIVKSVPIAVNILHDNLDEQTAFDLEVWYIREYRDIIGYDLCNINDGGEGNTHSKETRKKLSEARKGKEPWNKGKKGKSPTEETRKKMSEANKGKPPWNKGKVDVFSEETRKKISESNKGRTHSEKSKDKIKKSKKDKMVHIICLNDKKIYESITMTSLSYEIERASVRNCCNGYYTRSGEKVRYTNCKGYKFRYLTYKHNKKLRPINYKFKKAV